MHHSCVIRALALLDCDRHDGDRRSRNTKQRVEHMRPRESFTNELLTAAVAVKLRQPGPLGEAR